MSRKATVVSKARFEEEEKRLKECEAKIADIKARRKAAAKKALTTKRAKKDAKRMQELEDVKHELKSIKESWEKWAEDEGSDVELPKILSTEPKKKRVATPKQLAALEKARSVRAANIAKRKAEQMQG